MRAARRRQTSPTASRSGSPVFAAGAPWRSPAPPSAASRWAWSLTALIQGFLAGLGLVVTGVPFAAILTVVCVFLAIAQIGVLPVLACAVGWMYWTGSPAWATGLLMWSLFVVSIDNVLRPVLIRRGADLPLPLIFAGVLGGIVGFGIVGIFIGPVVLGVTYTLLLDWVKRGEAGGRSARQGGRRRAGARIA